MPCFCRFVDDCAVQWFILCLDPWAASLPEFMTKLPMILMRLYISVLETLGLCHHVVMNVCMALFLANWAQASIFWATAYEKHFLIYCITFWVKSLCLFFTEFSSFWRLDFVWSTSDSFSMSESNSEWSHVIAFESSSPISVEYLVFDTADLWNKLLISNIKHAVSVICCILDIQHQDARPHISHQWYSVLLFHMIALSTSLSPCVGRLFWLFMASSVKSTQL